MNLSTARVRGDTLAPTSADAGDHGAERRRPRGGGAFAATAPASPAWSVGTTPIAAAVKKIITRDAAGRELVVAYDDLQFLLLLPPKPDGTISIMFCLDADFDARGEDGHLHRAVSDELIKSLVGGTPSRLGTYALLPASMLAGTPTRAVTELATAWAAATG